MHSRSLPRTPLSPNPESRPFSIAAFRVNQRSVPRHEAPRLQHGAASGPTPAGRAAGPDCRAARSVANLIACRRAALTLSIRGPLVLVAEPYEPLLRRLGRELEGFCEVELVLDGAHAIEALSERSFDLLLFYIDLFDEAAKRSFVECKARQPDAFTRMLLVTTFPCEGDSELRRFVDANLDSIFIGPVSRSEFEIRIAAQLMLASSCATPRAGSDGARFGVEPRADAFLRWIQGSLARSSTETLAASRYDEVREAESMDPDRSVPSDSDPPGASDE